MSSILVAVCKVTLAQNLIVAAVGNNVTAIDL